MTTIEGLKKGGKTGVFFLVKNASARLVVQRMHLPLEDKKHMPPKGKKQLTSDEQKLIEWWINSGAEFEKKVGDLERDEGIDEILKKYVQSEKSVFSLEVPKAPSGTIAELPRPSNTPPPMW